MNNPLSYHGTNNDIQEYKTCVCAGLNCVNTPISILKVKYINKTGHFCQQCTADLLQHELAEEISKEVVLNA